MNPVDTFLQSLGSEATRRHYRNDLAQFFAFRGLNLDRVVRDEIHRVSEDDIARFKALLLKGGRKPATVNRKLSAIRSFFAWAERKGVIRRVPANPRSIRNVRVDASPGDRALSSAEVRQLLASCSGDLRGRRDRALILLAAVQGLRSREICLLRRDQIHANWIEQGDQKIELNPMVLRALRAYLRRVPAGEYVFGPLDRCNARSGRPLTTFGLYLIFRRRAVEAGLARAVTPQALRATAIRLAVEAGATMEQVMAHARHRNLKSTLRYFIARSPKRSAASLIRL